MQSLLDAAAAQSAADEADAAAARSSCEHSKQCEEGPDEDRNELEKELESGPLRRGKWNRAEEAYALKLIEEFHAGHLPLKEGTTLRAFLSGVLRCQPMRVSKKFVGDWAVGRRAFRRANCATRSAEESARKMTEIKKLEDAFLASLKKENAKKAGKRATAGKSQDEALAKKKKVRRRKMKESNSSSSSDSDASATSMGLMMLGRKPSVPPQQKPSQGELKCSPTLSK